MKSRGTQAKVFWNGRSQAVRLPKDYRFESDTVIIRQEGDKVILESAHDWPKDYAVSFRGIGADFKRPDQNALRSS
jgi:virulence-associated protein VagC